MADGSGLAHDVDQEDEVPKAKSTTKGKTQAKSTAKGKENEKDEKKPVTIERSGYETFESVSEHPDTADVWVEFARDNPQEFLKIIIDDFSSLRLVQALFVTASVGLTRSCVNQGNNHYLRWCGGIAGMSVLCNLFGIVMAIAVSSQSSGMRSMRATGEQVVAAIPKLFMLFYVAMLSFFLGMILMTAAVILLLFTSQVWEVSISFCFLAGGVLVLLIWILKTYRFGSSLATHAATLALEHLHVVHQIREDLESAMSPRHGTEDDDPEEDFESKTQIEKRKAKKDAAKDEDSATKEKKKDEEEEDDESAAAAAAAT